MTSARTATTPKNIVLLSDGTGNSAAKLMKTNVWRMYEAVDFTGGDQIALYSNGVGTSGFKPLAVLGGAFGWGLKRNVLDLYMFACRNYVPAGENREADRLYAFGFSRGAFTIRVLMGLIEDQGLVTGVRGRELERRARWAYRAYRRRFNTTGGLVGPLRTLRDWALRTWEGLRKRPRYDASENVEPVVRFVGLWDTVAAYGLPIDEMTRGWDDWVWPLSITDHTRPASVEKVCHALALDDERHTFHPTLFDEAAEPLRAHTDEERVTQVWFAGVHSNVGGGYPDDSLAHVSLLWMADEAGKRALRLHKQKRAEWEARADPHGPQYNPRRGLGVYYRYNPRSIDRLTNDRFARVSVPRVKIHESVFARIAAGRDDYAPIVLPSQYGVVTGDGAVLDAASNPHEHPTQATARCLAQERVWDRVWMRRVVYFATVLLTLALLVPPLVRDVPVLDQRSMALSGAIDLVGQFLPGFLQPWVAYYREQPVYLTVGVVLLTVFLFLSSGLQRRIADGMRGVWDGIVSEAPHPVPPGAPPSGLVYRWRTNPAYRVTVQAFSHRIFPFVFGFGALLVLILIVAGTVNRAAFAVASAAGRICEDTATLRPASAAGTWEINDFVNSNLCFATGVFIERRARYRMTLALPDGGWRDGPLPVDTPSGFGSGERPMPFLLALPFRRVLTAQWFVPMVRIGSMGAEYHRLNQDTIEFSTRRSGQLFLFVNDALGPWPFWTSFYDNNCGGRPPGSHDAPCDETNRGVPPRITVTRLE
jgi:uncharacterized protein (DUF2235 family)